MMWHFSCSVLCLTLQPPGIVWLTVPGFGHWEASGGEQCLLLHFPLLIARTSHGPHAHFRLGSFLCCCFWVFFHFFGGGGWVFFSHLFSFFLFSFLSGKSTDPNKAFLAGKDLVLPAFTETLCTSLMLFERRF